ncbi:hypothetical protein [Agrobacterium leguminum]
MLSALFLYALPNGPARSQVVYRRIPVKELASQKSICPKGRTFPRKARIPTARLVRKTPSTTPSIIPTLVFRGQRASQHDNARERMASTANSASSVKDALNCKITPFRSTGYSRLLLFSKRLTRQSASDDLAPRHQNLRQYDPISVLQDLPADTAKEARASVP